MKTVLNPSILLFIYFLVITGVISLRVYVEETSYISPDSRYYLRVAQNLVDGKGAVAPRVYPFDKTTEEKEFCMWPVGYPVLIAGMSKITGDVFLASKALNILCIGLMLTIFYLFYKKNAVILGLIFCFHGVLEVYSYTWSEGAFIVGLMGLWQALVQYNDEVITGKRFVLCTSLLLSFLFVTRYAGIVYIPFIILIGCYYGIFKNRKDKMLVLLSSCIFPISIVMLYFFYNYIYTGSMTGSERIFPFNETFSVFFLQLFEGLLNELTIARNYYFRGYDDILYVTLLIFQLLLLGYVYFELKKNKIKWKWTNDCKTLLLMSFYYLLAIIILRKLSPFDPFNYRILAPFSFPFWVAILLQLVKTNILWIKVRVPFISFLLLSLAVNLPKKYLLNLIGINL